MLKEKMKKESCFENQLSFFGTKILPSPYNLLHHWMYSGTPDLKKNIYPLLFVICFYCFMDKNGIFVILLN